MNSEYRATNLTIINYNLMIIRSIFTQGYSTPLESIQIMDICTNMLKSLEYSFPEAKYDSEN